jgi:thiol-disulfide isomerase/thioredoxin
MTNVATAAGLALALALLAPLSAQAAKAGEWAPDFSAPYLQKPGALAFADYHGKVVFLDFWASWCTSCRVEMPLLDRLRDEYRNAGFEVIAVNVDEQPADGIKALRATPVNYPVLSDPKGELAGRYELPAMPSSFLIGRDGLIHAVRQGFRESEFEDLRRAVGDLVREK